MFRCSVIFFTLFTLGCLALRTETHLLIFSICVLPLSTQHDVYSKRLNLGAGRSRALQFSKVPAPATSSARLMASPSGKKNQLFSTLSFFQFLIVMHFHCKKQMPVNHLRADQPPHFHLRTHTSPIRSSPSILMPLSSIQK